MYVCVCVCVWMCIYIYIYIYTHVYTHIDIYTYYAIYMYTSTYLHIYDMCVDLCIYVLNLVLSEREGRQLCLPRGERHEHDNSVALRQAARQHLEPATVTETVLSVPDQTLARDNYYHVVVHT